MRCVAGAPRPQKGIGGDKLDELEAQEEHEGSWSVGASSSSWRGAVGAARRVAVVSAPGRRGVGQGHGGPGQGLARQSQVPQGRGGARHGVLLRRTARQRATGRGHGQACGHVLALQSAPRSALPRPRRLDAPNTKKLVLRCSPDQGKHKQTRNHQCCNTLQNKIFRKQKMQQVFDEMLGALPISEKFPKITTASVWCREGVYEVGDHLGHGKLVFHMMSKNGHNGMI